MKKLYTIIIAMMFTMSMYSQWTPIASGTTQHLISTHFVTDNIGWVVGQGGTILKTTDGLNFTPQTSNTANQFYSTWFVDANTGFAVGDASTIRKTIDGGTTWTTVTSPVTADLRRVWFLNASIGFITGGISNSSAAILKTTDGGATWTALNTPLSQVVYGIYFTDALNGYASDYSGNIIKTTDGGSTWNYQTSGVATVIYSFFFVSPTAGFAVGANGVVLHTLNAGATWTSVTSGTTDWLFNIKFITTNIGYMFGGNVGGTGVGNIYKSTDGGVTWTVNGTSGNANRLYNGMIPGHTGYAVGLNGTILKILALSGEGVNEISEENHNIYLFPNPVSNNGLNLSFDLSKNENVSVTLLDEIGKECSTLLSENLSQGNHQMKFETDNLAKGIYFAKIQIGNSIETKKVIITR